MSSKSPEAVVALIEQTCRTLQERGRDLLAWDWDGRFSAALTVAKDPRLLALVEDLFQVSWDHERVRQAPDRIVQLCDMLGGIRQGQKLLTLDPDDDPLLFAAWWPWAGGATSSLRISCVAYCPEAKALGPLDLVRTCLLG